MTNISKTTLGKLIEFQRGYDLPKVEMVEGIYPVRSSNGILGYHNEYKTKGPGITIGRSGTVGIPHLIKTNFYPHNTALFIKDFKGNNIDYIFYLLKNLKLNDRKTGSGVPTMNRNHLHPLDIIAHLNLSTQNQIAKVLSDLDAKIEVNNKINQELEAMAKTLYDYWFVQFDFPRDLCHTERSRSATTDQKVNHSKGYKSSGGKMVFNEELKREIPEGWEDGVLSDIADITMGQSPAGSSYNDEGIGSVFYQGSTDFGGRFPTVRKYTTEPSRMAREGDILLSVRAPVGTLNQAMEDCCIGRGLAALREKEGSISFLWSQMDYFKQIFDRRNASGTTFGSITKDELFGLKLCIPEKEVLKAFKEIVDPLHIKIVVNAKQNQKLAALRDWLLPMLMNGQVRVGEGVIEDDLINEEQENLKMAAEPTSVYSNSLFGEKGLVLNYDYEVATIVLLTEKHLELNYGRKYLHKMFSNIQFLASLPKIDKLQFMECGWGMFSKGLATSINKEVFISRSTLDNGQKVYKLKTSAYKEVTNWISQPENKLFVEEVNTILSLYQHQLIKGNMDRIELLNTVLECIKVLNTYEFPKIYDKMKKWEMEDGIHAFKSDKFSNVEIMHMVALVRELKL